MTEQGPIEIIPGQPVPEPIAAPAELKVVITFRNGGALVGIRRTGCDPVVSSLEGTMARILSAIPRLVVTADTRWKTAKLNPESTCKPEPPPAAPTPTTKPAVSPKPGSPDVKRADGSVQTGLKL